MPITIGNVTTTALNASPGSSLSVSTHNHNGDFLLVDIAEGYKGVGSITSVTWNGVAMTLLGSASIPATGRTVYQYGLAGAATGTQTLTATWSGNDDIGARFTIRSFSGVNQSTPVGTTVTNTAVAGTSISANVSSATGEIVADAVDIRLSTATLTAGSGQTETSQGTTGWNDMNLDGRAATSYKAGATSTTMQWTAASATNLAIVATPIKPAAGGTQYNITPSGNVTSGGSIARGISARKSGSVASAGLLARAAAKGFAGSVTPAGVYTSLRIILLAVAGAIAPSGTLVRGFARSLSSAISSAGALSKSTAKRMTGGIASSGVYTSLRIILLAIAGAIAPSGTLVRGIARALSSAISSAGALSKSTAKRMAGSIASSGVYTSLRLFLLAVSGSVNSTGTIAKRTSKQLAGALAASGSVVKFIAAFLAGGVASAGNLLRAILPALGFGVVRATVLDFELLAARAADASAVKADVELLLITDAEAIVE